MFLTKPNNHSSIASHSTAVDNTEKQRYTTVQPNVNKSHIENLFYYRQNRQGVKSKKYGIENYSNWIR